MEKLHRESKYQTSDIHIDKKKFDIVFIGGGPSTLAFMCHLFQRKLADKVFGDLNILIIEKGENFGSGCLGKYGINSNTSSEGFPRLICVTEGDSKGKSAKFALSPSKNNMKESKNYKKDNFSNRDDKIKSIKNISTRPKSNKENDSEKPQQTKKLIIKKIPLFNELFECDPVQSLFTIGNRPAPLGLVGYYLDCLGNFIVHHVKHKYKKLILLNETEVKSIKMYNNEEFGILIEKKQQGTVDCNTDNNEINSNINNSSCNSNTNVLKARCLVLSSGAKQSVNNEYYDKLLKLKGENCVFTSDFALQNEGYLKLKEKLKNTQKKVVIIGGSHSGFSCAWILLNGPARFETVIGQKEYEVKRELNCMKCSQTCKCYGEVKKRLWHEYPEEENVELEVKILYRDEIKVYYPSEEEASLDGYKCYDPRTACNKQGKIYPFIGIRGDAKELYKKILNGEEKRVQLIKTNTNKCQLSHIQEADVVIWACGYISNNLPFIDVRNQGIEFLLDDMGSYEVDKTLNLVSKNKIPIKNLYGIGQGYSTKTPEIINGKKARADSIHIYNTYIAAKLYRSLESFILKTSIDNNKINSTGIHGNNKHRLSENKKENIQPIMQNKLILKRNIHTNNQVKNENESIQSLISETKSYNLKLPNINNTSYKIQIEPKRLLDRDRKKADLRNNK
jgi:hypothetical protein